MAMLLCLAGAIAFAALAVQPLDAPVRDEAHVWKPVVIKANGFINGVVYHPHPDARGLVYINTDMGGAYRLQASGSDAGKWVCLTDWINHDDWSLSHLGVETLAVDPTDPDRVYAGLGTYMGPSAVVRSSDRGRSWQRADVPFPMDGNGSARNSGQRMNVDPNLPSRLLYGTRTMGLWVSEDHAATWHKSEALRYAQDTAGATKDTGIVFTLFDRSSGRPGAATPVAYAGVSTISENKLWRTRDAGKTWSLLPGQPGGDLLPNRAVLTPDGKTLYVTYVVASGYPGPHGVVGGAVYRIDNPASDVPTFTDVAPATGGFGWSGVALDPTQPETVYVSTICRYSNPGDDIHRSTDRGMNWTPLQISANRDDSSAPYVRDFGMHWTGDVQVSPHDPDEAYFTTGWGLYRTTNLRTVSPTWAFYNEGFEQSAVLDLLSPPSGSSHLLSVIGDRDGFRHENLDETPAHGRMGQPNEHGQTVGQTMGTTHEIDLAWSAPDRVVRLGGRAQFSDDGGFSWSTFHAPTSRPSTQPGKAAPTPRAGRIAISHDGNRVVWAPRHAYPVFADRTSDGWSAWQRVAGLSEDLNGLTTDLTTPGLIYAIAGSTLLVSEDAGATFAPRATLPDHPRDLQPVPGQAGHLLIIAGAGGAGGLHRSTDGGVTWSRLAPEVVTVAKALAVGAPAPGLTYPAMFVSGTAGERRGFFRSDDAGQTWVRMNNDGQHFGPVSAMSGDLRIHGRLYVGTNGRGILYSDKAK
jgi:hypothetical protein